MGHYDCKDCGHHLGISKEFCENCKQEAKKKDKTMTDKMPTNIFSCWDSEYEVYFTKNHNNPNYLPKNLILEEYTLVHNNPDYYVIKKSDVQGDVLEDVQVLLEEIKRLLESIGVCVNNEYIHKVIDKKIMPKVEQAILYYKKAGE